MWIIFKVYWICYNIASVFSCFGLLDQRDLSSPTSDGTHDPCFGRQSLNYWITREGSPETCMLLSSKNDSMRTHGWWATRDQLPRPSPWAPLPWASPAPHFAPNLHTADRTHGWERERDLGLRAALPGLHRLSRLPHQPSASSPLKEGNLKPPKGFVRLPRDRAGTLKCEVHRAAQCELFLVLLLTAECGHPWRGGGMQRMPSWKGSGPQGTCWGLWFGIVCLEARCVNRECVWGCGHIPHTQKCR